MIDVIVNFGSIRISLSLFYCALVHQLRACAFYQRFKKYHASNLVILSTFFSLPFFFLNALRGSREFVHFKKFVHSFLHSRHRRWTSANAVFCVSTLEPYSHVTDGLATKIVKIGSKFVQETWTILLITYRNNGNLCPSTCKTLKKIMVDPGRNWNQ